MKPSQGISFLFDSCRKGAAYRPKTWMKSGLLIFVFVAMASGNPLRVFATMPQDADVSSVKQWRLADHPAVSRREVIGFSEPRRRLVLSSDVVARVISIGVDFGESVPFNRKTISSDEESKFAQFGVVIELDSSLVRSQLAVAQANHELAIAALDREVAVCDRWQLRLQYSQRKLVRLQELLAKKRATTQEVDDAQSAVEEVQGRLQAAQAEKRSRSAEILKAKAELCLQQERFRRHQLWAPVGWRVEQRWVEPGHLATIGEALLTLVSTEEFRVSFQLNSQEISALRQQPVPALYHQASDTWLNCGLEFVSSDYNSKTRKRRVDLLLHGTDMDKVGLERSGGIQFVLPLLVPEKSGGFLIPEQFVLIRLEQNFVQSKMGKFYAVTVLSKQGGFLRILAGKTPIDEQLVLPE